MLMKCFETDAAGSTSTTTESDTPQHCNEGHGVGIIATASTEGNERHRVGITTTTSTEDTVVWQPASSMQRRARRAIPDFLSHVWTGIAGRLPCDFLRRLLTAMPHRRTVGSARLLDVVPHEPILQDPWIWFSASLPDHRRASSELLRP